MREIRQSGLEGGGAREGAPYPYTMTERSVTDRKAPRSADGVLGNRAQSASWCACERTVSGGESPLQAYALRPGNQVQLRHSREGAVGSRRR